MKFAIIRNTIQYIKFTDVCIIIIIIIIIILFHSNLLEGHTTKQNKQNKQRNQSAIIILQRGTINYA